MKIHIPILMWANESFHSTTVCVVQFRVAIVLNIIPENPPEAISYSCFRTIASVQVGWTWIRFW